MQTSDFIKGLIVAYMDQGFSSRKASEVIQNLIEKYKKQDQMVEESLESQFNVSHMTCSRVYNNFRNNFSFEDKRQYNHPQSAYNEVEKEEIKEKVLENVGSSFKELAKNEDINPKGIKNSTFRKVLTEQGIKCYKQPNHREQRVKFANKVKLWNNKWQSIIFSDESQLCIDSNNIYYYTNDSSDITVDLQKQQHNYPLKVHVWGAISSSKPLFLKKIDGKLNQHGYIEILKEFIDKKQQKFPKNFEFQQDNSAVHTANSVNEYFQQQNIKLLIWSTKSPDLSPIENVWSIIKRELWQFRNDITNENNLFEMCEQIFYNSESVQNCIINSYLSLPKRVQHIIDKQGEMI